MPEPELTKAQKVFTMLGALLGLLLAALDQTIVATAGPVIQRELQIEPALYVWITTAYLVASTVLVPIYGKLSDLYGRKRILLLAIGVFLTGSLLCGISQSANQLIAFRAVQGVGSAGLFTSAFAVVADLFPPAERGKYQGIFGAAFGLSSVVGPLMGGFITDHFGWHWAFFINLPIGLVAIAFIVSRMPALRRADAKGKLDIAGAAALVGGVVPLLLALSLGHPAGRGDPDWQWTSVNVLGLFAFALAGTIAFVLIERRAADPVLDLRLFKNRTFTIGSLAAFTVGGAFLGAIVFLPLFMVNVVGLSATSSGLTTTPLTFGIVAANIASGQAVSRMGAYKGLLLGSLVILCGGFLLVAVTLAPDATQGSVTAKMVLLGIGLGPSIPLFTLAIQNAVPPHEIGVATAAATFFRQMGSTIGIAIVGTVFASSFATNMQTDMSAVMRDVPAQFQGRFAQGQQEQSGEGGGGRAMFDAAAIEAKIDKQLDADHAPKIAYDNVHATVERMDSAFKRAFTDAIIDVFWLALAIAGLGLAITLFLPALPLRKTLGPKPPVGE